MQSSQLTIVSASIRPGEVRTPLRLTSACGPTSAIPATRLIVARITISATANVPTASSLPANTSSRVHDRVRIVFHVP